MHDLIAFLSPSGIHHCLLVGCSVVVRCCMNEVDRDPRRLYGFLGRQYCGFVEVLGRSAHRRVGVLGCFSRTGNCCVHGRDRRLAGDRHRPQSEERRTGCTRF